MRNLIPQYVIGVLSEVIPQWETHASIDSLFLYANAPGDPPSGSKVVKVQEWLRRVNKTDDLDPIAVLGRIVEKYLEEDESSDPARKERNQKIRGVLERASLSYVTGGTFSGMESMKVRPPETVKREYYSTRNQPKPLSLLQLCSKLQQLYLFFRDKDYFKGSAGITASELPTAIQRSAALSLDFDPFPIEDWPAEKITEDHVFDVIEFLFDHVSKPGEWT